MSTKAKADDTVVDEVSITVPVACSMEGTGMASHTDSIPNGTYRSEIGSTTLKAYCNDAEGFAIYAIGYTDSELGKNTLVGSNTAQTIATGTATSAGTSDVSNWALKLNTDSSATYPITLDNGFGSYSAVPATYTKVAHSDASTDYGDGATGASLTTTYATYISKTQNADTYNGQVKFTLVHPASEEPLQPKDTDPGYIAYYPNASTADGTMGKQTLTTSATSATLLASNFSRSGYGFAGWNDKYDYSGNYYGPNEDITFTAGQYTGTNKGLSLYAVWVKSAGSMQEFTNTKCQNMNTNDITALTDERDGNTYAVARLADGNCWMIENLRLENTNSDNATGALAQGYNASFVGLADPESANFTDSTTANSLYSTDGSTSAPQISGSNTGYRFPRYNNLNTATRASNPSSNSFANDNTTPGMYSYGNYYTWPAAVADTSNYTTNNQSITSTSICPAGWHLPTGGTTTASEFGALSNALGGYKNDSGVAQTMNSSTTPTGAEMSKTLRAYPNNFLYSGDFNGSSAYGRGSYGLYWSSTVYSGYSSYNLYFLSSSVYPGSYYDYKYYGRSVRCVAGVPTS